MKKKSKVLKKTKVYECKHYEFDYDDLGKYNWCHNDSISSYECIVPCRGFYSQQFCPGFKKGNLRGQWVISDWEKKEAADFKSQIAKKAIETEAAERALYEHLKKKYG